MTMIFQSQDAGMADIRAAIVKHQGEADLCVKRVSSRGLAHGEALWYLCKDRGDAQKAVYFTSQGMAEIKICFVKDYGATGWVTEHRLKGRFR